MKRSSKNEGEFLSLINKIQEQLIALDKKIDTLVNRSLPTAKLLPVSAPTLSVPVTNNARLEVRPNDHNKGRMMHKAICADCKKECSIPFKPSGDRPVYCKDCFSRRKVISLSGIKLNDQPKEILPVQVTSPKEIDAPKAKAKTKKKAVTAKKPVTKKKIVPKKK